MNRLCLAAMAAMAAFAVVTLSASESFAATGVAADPCPRPAVGSVAMPPPELFGRNGELNVTLEYRTTLNAYNQTLFCFATPDGIESPTLHVRPGDTLNITLINKVPALPPGAPSNEMAIASDVFCGAHDMNDTSVNIHFHGTNTLPVCHSDEVIHTLVNAGETFRYSLKFPEDEPPGLYWYHPHVHGISEAALQGGATGLIVVDGIECEQPAVAQMPTRYWAIRDQLIAPGTYPGQNPPSWDLSLNYVPIAYPKEIPAVIDVRPGRKEFWRVANTAADTIVDLQLTYDGVVQPIGIVALDGVATGSQDGARRGTVIPKYHVLLAPAARAEFILTTPPVGVKSAVLKTVVIDNGPAGDNDTPRVIAKLQVVDSPSSGEDGLAVSGNWGRCGRLGRPRFEGIDAAPVATQRKLYFSEFVHPVPARPPGTTVVPTDSDVGGEFYITVDGQTPTLFNPANPPAIITRQGSVEEWTIENRTQEVHEFHMHQIHYQLRAISNVPVAPEDRQFYDTFQVPYWKGSGPYPSITVAMDFRGDVVGDFVYHCHILGHEDNGMMAIIRVLPPM